MMLTEHVHRYVDLKRKLGYEFTANASMLMLYAVFAEARHDRFTRTETIVDWASNSKSLRSSARSCRWFVPLRSGCMPRTHTMRCRRPTFSVLCHVRDRRRI